jgi:cysteinyl-tRNA synthetase
MDDDFNAPEGLSVLFQLSHEVNKSSSPVLAATLKHLAAIMGILQSEPSAFLQAGFADEERVTIEQLIAERLQARTDRNWERADQIRAQLLSQGIELEDGAKGTTWRKVAE